MLERPKLQLFLLLLIVCGAGLSFWLNGINLGTDLKGGTQLIYEVDPVDFQGRSEAERKEDMGQVVRIIAARVDPTGAKDIVVTRRGELGLLIELPGMSKQDAQQIEDRITRLGTLEDRLVAFTNYDVDDVTMGNLADEKRRLEDWLKELDRVPVIPARPFTRPAIGWLPYCAISVSVTSAHKVLGTAVRP